MGFDNNADPGHDFASGNSNAENNRLSSELNSTISREMDEVINSVSVQIQRAKSKGQKSVKILDQQVVFHLFLKLL